MAVVWGALRDFAVTQCQNQQRSQTMLLQKCFFFWTDMGHYCSIKWEWIKRTPTSVRAVKVFLFNTFDSFSFLAQIHSLLEHQPVRTPAHNLAFCSPHVLLRPPLVFLQPVCLYAAQNLCFLRLSTCSNIFDPLPWAVMWDLMNLRILTGSLGQLSYCAFSCLLP